MYYTREILLKSVEVIENGTVDAMEGLNGFSATLFFPKAGVPSVETIRKLTLKDHEMKDLTQLPFEERLLFKQDFQGRCVIKVILTAIEAPDKFDRVMHQILRRMVPGALGLLSGGVFTGVATGIAASVFELTEPKDAIRIIGTGTSPITPETPEGDLVVNLTVPQDIRLTQLAEQHGHWVKRTVTLKQGAGNARVVLDMQKLAYMPSASSDTDLVI